MPPSNRNSTLLLAGASVRSVAQSAYRAGYRLVAVDLFADADLRAIANVIPVRSVAKDLRSVAERIPPANWLYTGALENDPQVVDDVSRRHTLCGNSGGILDAIRDPRQLAQALSSAGLRYPESIVGPAMSLQGTWLNKPLRSCGGTGVYLSTAVSRPSANVDLAKGPRYLQRKIEGTVCSATYVATAGAARLLGVSRQLVGPAWCGAHGFQYAGSIGPLTLPDHFQCQLTSIGECLADRFRLTGLFGVDVVLDDRQVWTIEVNPRYCASVEILERAFDCSYLEVHMNACCRGILPRDWPKSNSLLHGKAIVYARDEVVISPDCFNTLRGEAPELAGQTWAADLPRPGTRIEVGHPMVTVFAAGCDVQDVVLGLERNAERVYALAGKGW